MVDASVVIRTEYAKGALGNSAPELIAAARNTGRRVLVDRKRCDFSSYRGADLVTPDRAELDRVVGRCPDARVLHNVRHGVDVPASLRSRRAAMLAASTKRYWRHRRLYPLSPVAPKRRALAAGAADRLARFGYGA